MKEGGIRRGRRRRKREKRRREGPIGNEHWVSKMFHPHQQLVQDRAELEKNEVFLMLEIFLNHQNGTLC